jgi:hypothetical protein
MATRSRGRGTEKSGQPRPRPRPLWPPTLVVMGHPAPRAKVRPVHGETVRSRRRFAARRLLVVGLVVVAVAVGSVGAAASLAYSPGYVFRVLAWQEADVGDAERFPAREIAAAPIAFSFWRPRDSDAAERLVEDAIAASGPGRSVARDFLESTGTQALLVVRGNQLLYEAYLGDFQRDSVGTSFSVAKSCVSALVGIAIGEGSIGSTDAGRRSRAPRPRTGNAVLRVAGAVRRDRGCGRDGVVTVIGAVLQGGTP